MTGQFVKERELSVQGELAYSPAAGGPDRRQGSTPGLQLFSVIASFLVPLIVRDKKAETPRLPWCVYPWVQLSSAPNKPASVWL